MKSRRQQFAMAFIGFVLLCSPNLQVRAIPPPPFADSDLTGMWSSNDGGIYYIRQIGTTVWGAGFYSDPFSPIPTLANAFHRGLTPTQVFRGTIAGSLITGDWVEIPRQATVNLRQGTVGILIVAGPALSVQTQ